MVEIVGIVVGKVIGRIGCVGKIGVMVERVKIEVNMYCCSD